MLGVFLVAGTVLAQDVTLSLSVKDPRKSMEANEDAAHLAFELVTMPRDALCPDEWWEWRSTEVLLDLYTSMAVKYFSHEAAHSRITGDWGFDTGDRTRLGFPRAKDSTPFAPFGMRNLEKEWRDSAAGLNQTAFNARESALRNSLSPAECCWYLCNKLETSFYTIYGPGNRQKQRVTESGDNTYLNNNVYGVGDIERYLLVLHERHVSLSKVALRNQGLIAFLASARTAESLSALGGYLCFDAREQVRWGDTWPPVVTHYLARNGGFYDVSFRTGAATLSLGHDVDFVGGGEVDRLRLGGEMDFKPYESLSVTPIAHADFDRGDFSFQGSSLGLRLGAEWNRIGASLQYTFSERDVVENEIKGGGRHETLARMWYRF